MVFTCYQAWKCVIKYGFELDGGFYSSSNLKKCHNNGSLARWHFLRVIKLEKVSPSLKKYHQSRFQAWWSFSSVFKFKKCHQASFQARWHFSSLLKHEKVSPSMFSSPLTFSSVIKLENCHQARFKLGDVFQGSSSSKSVIKHVIYLVDDFQV